MQLKMIRARQPVVNKKKAGKSGTSESGTSESESAKVKEDSVAARCTPPPAPAGACASAHPRSITPRNRGSIIMPANATQVKCLTRWPCMCVGQAIVCTTRAAGLIFEASSARHCNQNRAG